MEERRFFKRSTYEKNIRFNVRKDDAPFDTISRSINISGGGIGIATPQPLMARQNVALEITIPGYLKSIPARGEVVWADASEEENDCKAGIRFTSIDTYNRQLILDYVHFS